MASENLRFDFVSDLELWAWKMQAQKDKTEYTPPDWAAWQAASGSDTIIVAGDLFREPDEVVAELKRAAQVYKRVLYVDGNQEHKNTFYDFEDACKRIRIGTLDTRNITYLKYGDHIENGVAIIGRHAWWDFEFAPDVVDGMTSLNALCAFRSAAQKYPTGMRHYFAAQADCAEQDARELQATVRGLQNDDSVHSIVLVTHTLPHPGMILRGGSATDEMLGTAGSSLIQKMVMPEDTKGKIKLVLHGHLHYQKQAEIEGRTYICHARGTPGDAQDPNYAPRTLTVTKPETQPAPRPVSTIKFG